MKGQNSNKIFKFSLLLFLIIPFLTLFFSLTSVEANTGGYRPEVGIPGSQFDKGQAPQEEGTVLIGEYIKALYNYGIGIVGILAAVVLMIGGLIWLTAGGNANRVESAKQWIGGALTGLVLALTSYVLLYQINPELVNFNTRVLKTIERDGDGINWDSPFCCEYINWSTGEHRCSIETSRSACEGNIVEGYKLITAVQNVSCYQGTRCMNVSVSSDCEGVDDGNSCNSCNSDNCHCWNNNCIECGIEESTGCHGPGLSRNCCGNLICESGWLNNTCKNP